MLMLAEAVGGHCEAMAEAVFELEQNLRSRQPQNLMRRELEFLQKCRAKAVRDFEVGACLGAGVAWMATRRLNNLLRISLSGGAAAFSGLWRFQRSLHTSLDRILALNGSVMQKELANLIVDKYSNDPGRLQLISKHFYSEKVFDDSTSDRPKLRWRYRNFFGDNVTHDQSMHDSNSLNDSDSIKTDLESRQIPVELGIDVMADPLDCVFGYSGMAEVIHHSDMSSTSPRLLTRGHRRSRRRHRMRHHEVSSNSKHA